MCVRAQIYMLITKLVLCVCTLRTCADMLMIGVQGGCPDEGQTHGGGPWSNGFVQPTVTEQRTHFGLWCTLSAPLTLSIDFQVPKPLRSYQYYHMLSLVDRS